MNKLDTTNVIEAKRVNKSFFIGTQTVDILKDVEIKVKKGEFVSIMGPSGCGKSTLLYILGGLDSPTAGEVLISGKDIEKMGDREKGIMRRNQMGFIFQFYNLVQNLTVKENILLPIVMDGKSAAGHKVKLNEILKFVGLYDRRNFTPRELSGGQQQRVAIARSLIAEPELILADEPIGNLDSKSGTQVMELFKEINQKRGTTIIQVTHSKDAANYGNRVIQMNDGKIVS